MMNKVYKILLASLFSCCTFTVSAEETVLDQAQTQQPKQIVPTAQNTPAAVHLEKYSNFEKEYSLEYPSNWMKNDVPQLDLVLFAPPKEKDGNPHASMNVVSEKVGEKISLDQFYSESATNLTSALKDVKVEKNGTVQFNGVPSKWMQYTHVMQGVTFRVLQYFIVADQTIFLMTFSSSDKDFDDYRADFEKIANSFKIANQTNAQSRMPEALKK